MSDWQDISTAPKDGTLLLLGRFVKRCLYKRDGFIVVDRWHLPEHEAGYTGWGKFNKAWPPTHWTHLPGPPK